MTERPGDLRFPTEEFRPSERLIVTGLNPVPLHPAPRTSIPTKSQNATIRPNRDDEWNGVNDFTPSQSLNRPRKISI
ncbi:MAG: hypothetical protein RI897_420 [Verrucomicrobiota bacterium]|jgi:hypothetical protein